MPINLSNYSNYYTTLFIADRSAGVAPEINSRNLLPRITHVWIGIELQPHTNTVNISFLKHLEDTILFLGPMIPLFLTYYDVYPGFQSQGGSLTHFEKYPRVWMLDD